MQTTKKILLANSLIWSMVIILTILFAADIPIFIGYYTAIIIVAAIISLVISWSILQRAQNSSALTSIVNQINQINQINPEPIINKRINTLNTDELKKLTHTIDTVLNNIFVIQEQLKQHLNQNTEQLRNLVTFNKNLVADIEKNLSEKTNLEKADKNLLYTAYYDKLTGLPNYLYFHELIDKTLTKANRHKDLVAIFFLDIDNFKNITGNFDQKLIDLYLTHIATQLKLALRKTDLLARVSGDQFIIAVEELNSKEKIKIILDRIAEFLKVPFKVTKDQKLLTTSSIGISVYPNDSSSLEQLEAYASFAMYFAKKQGGNKYCYYEDIKNVVSMIA